MYDIDAGLDIDEGLDDEKKDEGDAEAQQGLPVLREGDEIAVASIETHQHFTQVSHVLGSQLKG